MDAYEPPQSNLTQTLDREWGPLYTKRQIGAAAFLGSIFAAFWVLGANYRELGHENARRRCLVIGGVATVAYLTLAYWLPEEIPAVVFAIFNVGCALYLADRLQSDDIELHRQSGGPLRSNWRLVGVSLACLIGPMLLIAIVAMFVEFALPPMGI